MGPALGEMLASYVLGTGDARSAVRARAAGVDAGRRLGGEMVVNARRAVVLALAAVSALLALPAPILVAQTAPATESIELKALTTELTSRRGGAGRSLGILPTLEQATADASWAEAFLARLHTLQPDRLTHDEWITYAMLENDASHSKGGGAVLLVRRADHALRLAASRGDRARSRRSRSEPMRT